MHLYCPGEVFRKNIYHECMCDGVLLYHLGMDSLFMVGHKRLVGCLDLVVHPYMLMWDLRLCLSV